MTDYIIIYGDNNGGWLMWVSPCCVDIEHALEQFRDEPTNRGCNVVCCVALGDSKH